MGSSSDEEEDQQQQVIDTTKYTEDIINQAKESKEEISEEEKKERIEAIKAAIRKEVAGANSKRRISELKRELEDLEISEKIKEMDVSINQNPMEHSVDIKEEDKIDLTNYWHYKVIHQGFVGDDGINLTNDDSSEDVYNARMTFIENNCSKPSKFHDLGEGLKIPEALWQSLFPHQRGAIEWLWGLFKEKKGGIEGDEMGLGKTCICAVFIGSLIQCGIINKPVLVLCPLTVGQQWIRELHIWCPHAKAILLHETRTNKEISKEDILRECEGTTNIVVSNYDTIVHMQDTYSPQMVDWSCIICDEAHKIRNHKTNISRLVKKLTGDFRLAVTGSPIQNSLIELWSLFDFAYPGLLGTLDVFEEEYADKIRIGSYANASKRQVYKAYYLAKSLRDIIKPYILRRMKADVQANLPSKTEQIFFCHLTTQQINAYESFLNSQTAFKIMNGNGDIFAGITLLRKICNHPSIYDPDRYGHSFQLSCKLKLLMKILPEWHKTGHRALLFSQMLPMLDILGEMLDSLGLEYFRMDGETPTKKRTTIMDNFNAGEKFCCILSTKVGGLGVNLTGADRVIIVDPDWNPANDMQALERSYRIGQKREVAVYRLICMGTIEEKMYKKQIFKQFLSNKIIQDPEQRRLFGPSTLFDLFSLDIDGDVEVIEAEKSIQKEKEEQLEAEKEAVLKDDDRDGDEDSESEDPSGGSDKALIKSLIDDGSIQRALKHEDIFTRSASDMDLVDKHKAENNALESRKKLEGSTKNKGSVLASRIRAQNDTEVERIQSDLLEFFKKNGNRATTKAILDRFKEDQRVTRDPAVLRMVLHRVSVLNKRTKTWFVIGRYK